MRELVRPNAADLDEFRRGIEPLASVGKLGSVLAQFPASFKDGPAQRDYLSHLLRALSEYPIAVELRHRSWSDAFEHTLDLLNGAEAAWVQIDEPKFTLSIRQNRLPNVKGFYYMRLHGRNAEQWWRHDKSEDRYNYLYSADELKEFSETADSARRLVKKAYLYTNNHFSAKSVANAAMIKQQLGEPIDGEYPPEFVAKVPGTVRRREGAERRLLADACTANLKVRGDFRPMRKPLWLAFAATVHRRASRSDCARRYRLVGPPAKVCIMSGWNRARRLAARSMRRV